MSNNYLKNILDKNSQSTVVVEPRFKSRFENNSDMIGGDLGTHDSEIERQSIQNAHPARKHTTLKRNVGRPNDLHKSNASKIIKNVKKTSEVSNVSNVSDVSDDKEESKSIFSNQTESQFIPVSKEKTERESKNENEVVTPILSEQTAPSIEEYHVSNIISEDKIENKTFGLLNKPVKEPITNESRYDDSFNQRGQHNDEKRIEQPSIKISIGRIEVKAVKDVPNVSAKQKSPKPNLKMSLEDYIDQRK